MVDEVSSDGADSDDNLDKGKKFRELLKVNTNYALVQKIVKINEDLVKSTNVDRLKVGADDLIPMMIDTIKKDLKNYRENDLTEIKADVLEWKFPK